MRSIKNYLALVALISISFMSCGDDPVVTFDCDSLSLNIGDTCMEGGVEGTVDASCECFVAPLFDCETLMLNVGDNCILDGIQGDVSSDCLCAKDYSKGIIVINEGPFSGGTATIDFISRTDGALARDIYQAENNVPLGVIAQSMTVIGDKAYIVLNVSGRVQIVDMKTFEIVGSIDNLDNPRYMLGLGDGTAVISQWGVDGISGFISRVNLSTNEITEGLALAGPEQMTMGDGVFYVANSGGFAESNILSIIDLNFNVVDEITVGKRLIGTLTDMNGDIWAHAGGSYSSPDATGGELCKIVDNVKTTCIAIDDAFSRSLTQNITSGQIYFAKGNKVEQMGINDTNLTTFFEGGEFDTVYGLGADPVTGNVYVSITPDFASESTTIVLDAQGNEIERLTTGVLTNSFAF